MTYLMIVDDEGASSRTLKLHFERQAFEVATALSAEQGLEMLADRLPDVLVSDIRMPGRDGLSLLSEVHAAHPDLPVIMITAFHDLDSTVAAMHGGAIDYVTKPIDLDKLEKAINKALSMRADIDASDAGDALIIDDFSPQTDIVGSGAAMQEVFKAIGKFSQSRITVLIQGETGTGKALVANAIHRAGGDAKLPIILVDCAATNDEVIDEELFGHVGNGDTVLGKVALAGEGTLYLENIHALSSRMQGKVLQFIESETFTPAGSEGAVTCAPRVIASSCVDLSREVADGDFREDLFYQLNPFSIFMPPLQERMEDIPELVSHLLSTINVHVGRDVRRVSADAMDVLYTYDWPGNMDQLHNALTKAVVMTPGDTITKQQICEGMQGGVPGEDARDLSGVVVEESQSLKELEREHIYKVLSETGWHKGRACKILGISRPRLDRRIDEYGFTRDT